MPLTFVCCMFSFDSVVKGFESLKALNKLVSIITILYCLKNLSILRCRSELRKNEIQELIKDRD